MNKLQKLKDDFINSRVFMLGLGISNISVIDLIKNYTSDITIFDKRNEDEIKKNEKLKEKISEYKKLGICFKFGDDYIKSFSYDLENNKNNKTYIIRSPSVNPNNEFINNAIKNGVILTSEIEMFLEYKECKVIGVSGSDGKSTTTTLIYEILKNAGIKTRLGGNIGLPILSEIKSINKDEIAILELSSFQLFNVKSGLETAIITNITPNHLDWHTDYNQYIESKKNIVSAADKYIILNYDNVITKNENFIKDFKGEHVLYFSSTIPDKNDYKGVYLDNKDIIFNFENFRNKKIFDVNDIKILGKHNIENFMAAVITCSNYCNNDKFLDSVAKVAFEFKGLKHRLEYVKEVKGVKYYNSSIDTSPLRTITTLSSLEKYNKRIILIAGGKNKGLTYETLGKVILEKVKKLILVGENSIEIKNSILKILNDRNKNNSDDIRIINEANDIHKNFEIFEIINYEKAIKIASEISIDGDIVVLSPAGTSFDRFKNFEERGDLFKNLVNNLN